MPPKKSTKPASKEAPKKPASKGKPASKAAPPKKEPETAKTGEKRKHSPDADTTPLSSASLSAILASLKDDASTKFASSRPDQPNLFDHMDASAKYTPWQNLVACVVMSKPISSRLGVRTLRTLFEDKEIDYTTPEKMKEAGGDARYQALDKSKTQHKDKTSLQLGRLAETVLEKYSAEEGDTSLSKLRDEVGGSADNLNKVIKGFYGFGDTASDIFRRRMQADWEELYPFADERAMNAAGHLGLADESAEALAQQVKELLPPDNEDAERAQFARIVDALVAVDLEHQYEELLEQIGPDQAREKKAKVE